MNGITIYSNGSSSFASMGAGEIIFDIIILCIALWVTIRIAKA